MSGEMPGGLRERKKAKTRQALIDTALELFIRNGFDQTTVEQIAEACDVAPRTFFRYFPSKEDLLFADSEAHLDQLLEALAARPAEESALRAVRNAVLELTDVYEHEREALLAKARVMAEIPSCATQGLERQQGWEQELIARLARREPSTDPGSALRLRLVAAASTAAMRAAVDVWIAGDDGRTLQELIAEAFDRLAEGLDGPADRA